MKNLFKINQLIEFKNDKDKIYKGYIKVIKIDEYFNLNVIYDVKGLDGCFYMNIPEENILKNS